MNSEQVLAAPSALEKTTPTAIEVLPESHTEFPFSVKLESSLPLLAALALTGLLVLGLRKRWRR